jgi:hypothetical protein
VALAPIAPFARFVIMAAGAVYANWDTIKGQFDRAAEVGSVPLLGYYSQHVFEMTDSTGAFSPRERGMFGIHWVNTTGGDPDYTWTSADYLSVESGIETMWTAIAAWISNEVRLVEHRWYGYGPGVVKPNPPSRVTTLATPKLGTGSQASVRQVAQTVTLRTPLRRHWGRIYLPISSFTFDDNGQISASAHTSIANAARTALMVTPAAQGIVPVVYDRQRGSALGVTAVECDTVPDIIRRRRPRTPRARTILTS